MATRAEDNYRALCNKIHLCAIQSGRKQEDISLVAVTKNRPWALFEPFYRLGQKAFGESKVQELLEKISTAPSDIDWHFIGNLQRNKVKKIIGKCALIHSVDSYELASKISECSLEGNLTTPILLQVNTSGEISKNGLSAEEWRRCFEKILFLKGIEVQGLMTMAPLSDDEILVRKCFSNLRKFAHELSLPKLSMGMSHDYQWAIKEGATIVRVGSYLFEGCNSAASLQTP